jgi:hypothetical protein
MCLTGVRGAVAKFYFFEGGRFLFLNFSWEGEKIPFCKLYFVGWLVALVFYILSISVSITNLNASS